MFNVDPAATVLFKYWNVNWKARLLKEDLDVCGLTIQRTGLNLTHMLPLNELLKIESVGDLELREHVDLLLQKTTADDDDDGGRSSPFRAFSPSFPGTSYGHT